MIFPCYVFFNKRVHTFLPSLYVSVCLMIAVVNQRHAQFRWGQNMAFTHHSELGLWIAIVLFGWNMVKPCESWDALMIPSTRLQHVTTTFRDPGYIRIPRASWMSWRRRRPCRVLCGPAPATACRGRWACRRGQRCWARSLGTGDRVT